MKLIRLTDDRWVLAIGNQVTSRQAQELGDAWTEWWEKPTGDRPLALLGSPIEYEDRREPDIEARLRRIEEHIGLDTETRIAAALHVRPEVAGLSEGES
jgi:hypothetical protein